MKKYVIFSWSRNQLQDSFPALKNLKETHAYSSYLIDMHFLKPDFWLLVAVSAFLLLPYVYCVFLSSIWLSIVCKCFCTAAMILLPLPVLSSNSSSLYKKNIGKDTYNTSKCNMETMYDPNYCKKYDSEQRKF